MSARAREAQVRGVDPEPCDSVQDLDLLADARVADRGRLQPVTQGRRAGGGGAQRVLEEAMAYKEQVLANAEGEAERFNKLLAEYLKAPEVTRERLYLDAVQGVMSSTNKVMVDVEGGNNVMYLPLDKLTAPSAGGAVRDVTIDSSNIRELTNAVTEQLRRDAAAAGTRRGGR